MTLCADQHLNNFFPFPFSVTGVQSEPLYVPMKFQDVPAEHSNCLIGDCESCKYTVDVVIDDNELTKTTVVCWCYDWYLIDRLMNSISVMKSNISTTEGSGELWK